jgi:hypothetical protein
VLVATLLGVSHAFWVVLGTVCRCCASDALGTVGRQVQAVIGTVSARRRHGRLATPAVLWCLRGRRLPVRVHPEPGLLPVGQAAFSPSSS